MKLPWVWGATPDEVAKEWGADRWAPVTSDRAVRAVSVAARPEVVFAWLGNLRVAPYSYDLVDNLGRRSPLELRPDLGPLEAGQQVMTIFTAVEVVDGQELVLTMAPGPGRRVFGEVVVSYSVVPDGRDSRLVAVMHVGRADRVSARVRATALAWGDLPMMRKQLLTLAELSGAELAKTG